MRWNIKKMFFTVAVLAILSHPATHAEETETLLRWKNGDALPGQLLESGPGTPPVTGNEGKVHWVSPHFLDRLVVDISVLDAIVFPKQVAPATEIFRVGTISGDIWIANLVGSDDNAFVFSSKRHGSVSREPRDDLYV